VPSPPSICHEGWSALEYSSPFAQLALALNLNWLALLLYADAFVSPSGTGTTYTATTARMISPWSAQVRCRRSSARSTTVLVFRAAMWFNLLVSFLFLFFFRGWGKLAEVISLRRSSPISWCPVSVAVLRRTAPRCTARCACRGSPSWRRSRLCSTLMLYWARWPHTGQIMLLLFFPMPIYLYSQAKGNWVDFAGISRVLGADRLPYPSSRCRGRAEGIRGRGYIGYGWDQLCVVLVSLCFFFWGLRSGWRTQRSRRGLTGNPPPREPCTPLECLAAHVGSAGTYIRSLHWAAHCAPGDTARPCSPNPFFRETSRRRDSSSRRSGPSRTWRAPSWIRICAPE